MINCTLVYNKGTASPHLRQIFTGFFELHRRGIVNIDLVASSWISGYSTDLLKVNVGDKHTVIYDTSDGVAYGCSDYERHLENIRRVVVPNCDVMFKRSYTAHLAAALRSSITVLPLGFNYNVTSVYNKMDRVFNSPKGAVAYYLKSIGPIANILRINPNRVYDIEKFEYAPLTSTTPKILFLTRLWDPDNRHYQLPADRRSAIAQLNEMRVACILACKREFKPHFIGGLWEDSFSRARYPELLSPRDLTTKASFLRLIKECEICVTTTGLNNSTGWKFGEYVAASRAIVSEPLHSAVPGPFRVGDNYLEFTSLDEMMEAIRLLYNNEARRRDMMRNNSAYYSLYLRPERLILNSLFALDDIDGAFDTLPDSLCDDALDTPAAQAVCS